ncbi:MAG: MFS transporter [Candidatus Bipolaricaulota bacterium]|nr:MFS transporter [Candidatus Bipolaricaulota bacterium]MDW8030390.1 MDR family MFS transporter [Candidatus Bipolaricaulota bacterium]
MSKPGSSCQAKPSKTESLVQAITVEPIPLTPAQRTAVTLGIMLGLFLGALEATVVGTAMPTVIASLGGLHIYSWVFSAYVLTSTVTVPIWGRLSDLYGRKRFLLWGIAIFLVGSALSGAATSMTQLVLFRTIQGLGAGALLPLGMTLIGEIYSLEKRTRMQGLFSGVWGVASIIGPLLGGFITDNLSWRWVFYINIPFGIAAALCIGLALVEPQNHRKKVTVDYAGAITLIALTTLLLLTLSQRELSLLLKLGLFGTCALLLVLFVVLERRAREPIVPLSLFRHRIFSVSSANGFFVGMAMFGSLSFIPLFVQGVIGTTATEAGTTLTPFMLCWVGFSIVGSRMIVKIGYRPMALLGAGLLVAGFLGLTTLHVEASRSTVMGYLALAGAGMGFSMVTLLIVVQTSVPRDQLGIATSGTVFFRSIGGAVGVAVMGAVLSAQMQAQANHVPDLGNVLSAEKLADLLRHPDALINPTARAQLPAPVLDVLQQILATALHWVFVVGLIVAVLALIVTLFLPGGTAQEHGGRTRT